jgi:hypothetical protein
METPRLVERLRKVEERARTARKTIATGVQAGLPVNGTSALRDIEMEVRTLVRALETPTGAPKGARRGTTPSSRVKGA